MTYKDWLADWLENYVKLSSKTNTYSIYKLVCTQHIVPYLGQKQLSELSVVDLQKLVAALQTNGNILTGKGLSAGSINLVVAVVQNSLKTAHLAGLTPFYFANRIKRPRCEPTRVKCFTAAEQKKIEQYVFRSGKGKLFGIVLCLYTGLRIGELLALTWQDIDFSQKVLRVSKTCRDGGVSGGGRSIGSPKTPCSCRVIPIPDRLLCHLKKLKSSCNCNYVVSSRGKPIFVRSYQRTFALLLKKLGIPHKGFHSLRHTFATRALECGVDVKTLSELLGHKNANVTLNRYAHSLIEHKVAMMNKLGKMLREVPQESARRKS